MRKYGFGRQVPLDRGLCRQIRCYGVNRYLREALWRLKMRRAVIVVLCGVLTASVFVRSGSAEETWLQYRTSEEPWRHGVPYVQMSTASVETAPETLALPESLGEGAAFAKWMTPLSNEGFVWLAFSRRPGQSNFTSFYIDSDCDGSLADETKMDMAEFTRFGPVRVIFKTEDGPVTYHLLGSVYRRSPTELSVTVQAACWYEGTITAGGRKTRIALFDSNVNGTFNDSLKTSGQADMMRIGDTSQPSFLVGKYVQIGGVLYTPDIAVDGALVELAQAVDVPTGIVEVPDDVDEISLAGENGLLTYDTSDSASPDVPVGSYYVYAWLRTASDNTGKKWTMKGGARGGEADIDVVEGEKVRVEIGAPTATVTMARNEGQWFFSSALQGSGGEAVQLSLAGGYLPPAPKLTITNEDGTYRNTYSFQYG